MGGGQGVGGPRTGRVTRGRVTTGGRLGTRNTKFISFPAKAEAQLMLGHEGEAERPRLCWARPPCRQRAVSGSPAAGPTFPQTRGTENPTSPGPSANPCLPRARLPPRVAAALPGVPLGSRTGSSLPHGPCMWHGSHSLCFAWGEGMEVSERGLSALAGLRGPPKYII